MNVIVCNEEQDILMSLGIDIIKSITGTYEPTEIVEMFKNFFFNKMIIDVTAIKHYTEIKSYEIISKGLNPDKIIFYIPDGSSLCTANFLADLVNVGIYNFTTNPAGVKTLIDKSNTFRDVENLLKMKMTDAKVVSNNITNVGNATDLVSGRNFSNSNSIVIGFKNVTEHAGTTSLIYMLLGELKACVGKDDVVALEVDNNDFQMFNDKSMLSIRQGEVKSAITKLNKKIFLIDMNDFDDISICSEVYYLIEPSTLKLNKLIRKNKSALMNLRNNKVLLNQSLLNEKDVSDFESEANLKVFFNLPPLDDRKRNAILTDFLIKIGLMNNPFTQSKMNTNKIFGLFRR